MIHYSMLPVLIALVLGCGRLEAASGRFNELNFETKGKGPALVLIHGGQMDRRMWDAQFDLFARQYRVVRYDIRGFGKSKPPTKGYSYADDLKALLQHLDIREASLIGLSLGAAIATDTAIAYPEMVRALILVCPGLGGFQFKDKANDLRPIVEAARDQSFDKAADLWLQNPYMAVAMENPTLRQKLRQLSVDNGRCWLNNPVLLRRLSPPAVERLRDIRAPTLVVGGERDVSDIHAIVEKLTTEIPRAEKRTIAGAGHIVPMEKPDEFNKVALEFLAKQHATPK